MRTSNLPDAPVNGAFASITLLPRSLFLSVEVTSQGILNLKLSLHREEAGTRIRDKSEEKIGSLFN